MRALLLLACASLALGGCAEVIDAGSAGVRSRYGEVDNLSLSPGFYWYNPFSTDVIEMNVQVNKWKASTPVYTKDIQQAEVWFAATYHLDPKRAHLMYQRVGINWSDSLLPQVVTQAIKNEFGKWNAVSVIANRGQVQSNIRMAIAPALAQRMIVLDGFEVTNIDYTDAFEQAVEDKEVAVQSAIAEVNRTKQIEEQGRQKVISAEAEARSIQLRSAALQSSPKLVEWEAVQKWNGELPTYVGAGTPVPFINVK